MGLMRKCAAYFFPPEIKKRSSVLLLGNGFEDSSSHGSFETPESRMKDIICVGFAAGESFQTFFFVFSLSGGSLSLQLHFQASTVAPVGFLPIWQAPLNPGASARGLGA